MKKHLKDKSKYIRYQQKINYFKGRKTKHRVVGFSNELMQPQKFWMYFGPLGPQTPAKMKVFKVLSPKNMGEITPKNEGFTWVPMVGDSTEILQSFCIRRCLYNHVLNRPIRL